ncbi:MAG: hypothetical protein GY838_09805 [bacterium]|nr:hypothetical protein [bacterium]
MNLREKVQDLVTRDEVAELNELVADEPRAIRYLVGCSYQPDERVRETACRALGNAARHHPEMVDQVVRRLIWAMNDESGTNALTAPAVVKAIADVKPELLLPLVPDLVRLAADEGLHEELAETLRHLVEKFPGSVGRGIGESLNKECRRIEKKRRQAEIARKRKHGF